MIEWLTIAGQASVLKQFFAVDMVIQNLAGSPVELDGGSATLNLPDGLSLAPTATPQSATQSVGTIAAGQSAAVEWIVRGDTPGSYYLSADYHATLQPFNQPIPISAQLHDPLVVYGADALKLSVQADSGSMVVGQPYHVRLAVTNTAPVPFYNVGLSTLDNATNFIFQPLQTFSSSMSTLNPGQTLYSPWFILVPALPSAGDFDPSAFLRELRRRQDLARHRDHCGHAADAVLADGTRRHPRHGPPALAERAGGAGVSSVLDE